MVCSSMLFFATPESSQLHERAHGRGAADGDAAREVGAFRIGGSIVVGGDILLRGDDLLRFGRAEEVEEVGSQGLAVDVRLLVGDVEGALQLVALVLDGVHRRSDSVNGDCTATALTVSFSEPKET